MYFIYLCENGTKKQLKSFLSSRWREMRENDGEDEANQGTL
jgi:hypothetical protein